MRRPGQLNVDLRLQKSFFVGDNTIELIADMFNVTNRANPWRRGFAGGEVEPTLGAQYPLSGEPSFGEVIWVSKPREVRLGVRFIW